MGSGSVVWRSLYAELESLKGDEGCSIPGM